MGSCVWPDMILLLERKVGFMTWLKLFMLGAVLVCSSCATVPYHYGKASDYVRNPHAVVDKEPQVTYGTPHGFLDASGWIWPGSLFGKLILWNYKVDSHRISTQTVAAVQQFLADNELQDVKVRINDYCVGAEFRRTIHNKAVAPGWRYTFGIFSWLGYTIMPGRFFGGDNYNPYSNTINLYSDLKPIGLHESGHSKDFAQRTYKGTYAFFYTIVPGFNLYPEAKASTEALSYLRAKGDVDESKAAYKLLYPAYATYIGGTAGSRLAQPWIYLVEAGVVIPAHIVGRIKAARVPDNLEPQPLLTHASVNLSP